MQHINNEKYKWNTIAVHAPELEDNVMTPQHKIDEGCSEFHQFIHSSPHPLASVLFIHHSLMYCQDP